MELKTHNCEPNLSPKIYNNNTICGLQRKREMKKLEKELQETEAVESQQKRAKLVSAGHNFFFPLRTHKFFMIVISILFLKELVERI